MRAKMRVNAYSEAGGRTIEAHEEIEGAEAKEQVAAGNAEKIKPEPAAEPATAEPDQR